MSKFTGNIIRLPAVTPTQNSASGVYTLDDQFTAQSSGTWPIVRDQYFNYTTLLLTGAVQGTAYPNPVTQPYSFLSDASTNNFVVSPNGDVSARPFNPYLNNYSNRFDGSSGQLAFPTGSFVFGNSDFTIEAWVYNTGTTTGAFFHNQYTSGVTTTSMILAIGSTSNFDFYVGSSIYTLSNVNPALNQWVHLACVRTGGTISIFQNGTRTHTRSDLSTLSINAGGTAVAPQIGNSVNGYMSNHRIIIGSGPYDATQTSITVPTTPLTAIANTKLLTCQANRFIDTNTQVAAKTITVTGSPAVSQNSPFVSYDTTNGSGYFDGTGDYLNAGSSSSLACGSGSFTVETWIYPSVLAQSSIYASTANGGQFFSFASGQGIGVGRVNVAWDYSTNVFPVYYAWNHIVWVRSGSNLSIYLNGTRIGNTTNSQNYTLNGGSATIGTEGSIASTIPGCYISNFRVAPGTAIYDPTLTTLTNTLTGATGVPTAPLPVVSGTSLLTLQTRAPSTNNGFIDSSPNNFVVTRNGNTTQGSFSPFSPTGWGNYFAGSQSISIAATASLQYSGDFTIECWFYKQATGDTSTFVQQSTNYFALNVNPGTGINIYLNSASANFVITDRVPQINTWHHIALVRSGSGSGNIKCYLDGVASSTTVTNTSTLGYNAIGYLGALGTQSAGSWVGYISNFRIVSGRAVYTSNFTPPALPLTRTTGGTNPPQGSETIWLTAQSNRFLDSNGVNTPASSPLTITVNGSPSVQAFSPFAPAQSYIPSQIGGSGYFDGSDALQVPSNPLFNYSSTDMTVELWLYLLTIPAEGAILELGTGATTGDIQLIVVSSAGGISFGTSGRAKTWIAVAANQWYHIAGVKSGSTYYLYVNGTRYTTESGNSTSSSTTVNIGSRNSTTNYLTGYMSNYKISNYARYNTTTIPVPTTPAVSDANTSLLLNFTNGGIVDATGKNNLETLGNSGVQTSQTKWPPGSIYLSGDGNHLISRSSPVLSLNGDFTMEAWVYPINAGRSADAEKYGTIMSCAAVGVSNPEFSWFIRIVGGVITEYFLNLNFTTVLQVTGLSVSINAWHYFAVTRSGTGTGNLKLYIDGNLVGTSSGAVTQTATFTSAQTLMVGRNAGSTAYQNWLSGYFQGLRITPGYVRNVTSSPTGPFPLG